MDNQVNKIETILEEIRQKHFQHSFLQQDAAKLREVTAEIPCHLAAQLMLIESSMSYWRFFPDNWTIYYQEAIDKGNKCWKSEELAEIYLLGALLYSYDQNSELKREASAKAFELAPNNSQAILRYLGEFWDELDPNSLIHLIKRISESNPDHPRFFYVQARHFEDYAVQCNAPQYLDSAIEAYQKTLEMGMNSVQHGIPSSVSEAAIERLSSKKV